MPKQLRSFPEGQLKTVPISKIFDSLMKSIQENKPEKFKKILAEEFIYPECVSRKVGKRHQEVWEEYYARPFVEALFFEDNDKFHEIIQTVIRLNSEKFYNCFLEVLKDTDLYNTKLFKWDSKYIYPMLHQRLEEMKLYGEGLQVIEKNKQTKIDEEKLKATDKPKFVTHETVRYIASEDQESKKMVLKPHSTTNYVPYFDEKQSRKFSISKGEKIKEAAEKTQCFLKIFNVTKVRSEQERKLTILDYKLCVLKLLCENADLFVQRRGYGRSINFITFLFGAGVPNLIQRARSDSWLFFNKTHSQAYVEDIQDKLGFSFKESIRFTS